MNHQDKKNAEKEKEITVIEFTLRSIFKKEVVRSIDVMVSNKLFDKWKALTGHKEDDTYPLTQDVLDREPIWKLNHKMK